MSTTQSTTINDLNLDKIKVHILTDDNTLLICSLVLQESQNINDVSYQYIITDDRVMGLTSQGSVDVDGTAVANTGSIQVADNRGKYHNILNARNNPNQPIIITHNDFIMISLESETGEQQISAVFCKNQKNNSKGPQ